MSVPKLGLILSAGGARAAYQVGVLRYLAQAFPNVTPSIFSGISAGSINASYFAQGDDFRPAAEEGYKLWEQIEFSGVMKTNFTSIFAMAMRWLYDASVSKVTKRLLLKSLLDASPLSATLLSHIHFWKITRAIRQGKVDGLSICATNYHDGATTIFFDSHQPIAAWRREQRRAIRTTIRVRHVMASCSIPILFEPIRIGDFLYGDGSLRFNFPFSPAIHLGSTHVLAIGIKCPVPENPLGYRPDHVSLGFVAGVVLNSIFLDSIEADYEHLCRMNELADGRAVRKVHPYLIRPSRDLGAMASEFLGEVPFHLRQFLRSTASPKELGSLLSYLMFSPGYIRALLQLGMEDAARQHEPLKRFFESAPFPNYEASGRTG